MRKVSFIVMSLAALLFTGTGCLKDKGFENNEYGINGADNSPAGIGFHKGVTFKLNLGLDLSPDPQVIDDQAVIMLFAANQPRTTSPLQWPSMKRSLTTTTPKTAPASSPCRKELISPCLPPLSLSRKEPSK
ncbi:MAG: hypothetical protein U0T56_01095 [Ferruginibacter sp.]